jgi:hypothetical protein
MKFKRLLRILRNYMNNELDSEILNIIKSSIRDLKSRTETLTRINRLPAPLPARRAYRPEGRSYGSERKYKSQIPNHLPC